MRKTRIVTLLVISCLSLTSWQHVSGQQRQSQQAVVSSDATKPGVSSKLAKAISVGEIKVSLSPVTPDGAKRLGWSPKGSKIPLTANGGALVGRLGLKQASLLIRFQAPKQAGDAATLGLDLNGNGEIEAAEESSIDARLSRGKYWYSSNADIQLPFEGARKRSYPIGIWYVVDPEAESPDRFIRWSRRGWHEGRFKFLGEERVALVSDRAMDGVFDKRDAWGLGKTAKEARSYQKSTASLASHNWLDGVPFQVTKVDADGRFVTIRAFDLGRTEEEDRKRSDPYAKDRAYARAKKPIEFLNNLDDALAKAKREDKRVLVDFVTTWCGPCAVMDQLVYTAEPMAKTKASTLFVKLDGDKEKTLRKKYSVRAYPTVILLDSDGAILKTAVGYQSVEQMLKLLK